MNEPGTKHVTEIQEWSVTDVARLFQSLRDWVLAKFGQDEVNKAPPQPTVFVLESGARVEMRRVTGRDIMRASRKVDVDKVGPMGLVLAIVAETATINGKQLTFKKLTSPRFSQCFELLEVYSAVNLRTSRNPGCCVAPDCALVRCHSSRVSMVVPKASSRPNRKAQSG